MKPIKKIKFVLEKNANRKLEKIVRQFAAKQIRKHDAAIRAEFAHKLYQKMKLDTAISSLYRDNDTVQALGIDISKLDDIIIRIANQIASATKININGRGVALDIQIPYDSILALGSNKHGVGNWLEHFLSRGAAVIELDDGLFRVNPKYTGTTSNNFITRSINAVSNDVAKIIAQKIGVV